MLMFSNRSLTKLRQSYFDQRSDNGAHLYMIILNKSVGIHCGSDLLEQAFGILQNWQSIEII
jgi:hypothetical protein